MKRNPTVETAQSLLSTDEIILLERNKLFAKFIPRTEKGWQLNDEIPYVFMDKPRVAYVATIRAIEGGSQFIIRIRHWVK